MEPFVFWCQKVLPLVYDDSLSYYEVLCKVVKYINDLIEQDKIFSDDITTLQAQMTEVQKALEGLDKDTLNATITEIATNVVNQLTAGIAAEQIQALVPEMISTALSENLENVVTPLITELATEIVNTQIGLQVPNIVKDEVDRTLPGEVADQLTEAIAEVMPTMFLPSLVGDNFVITFPDLWEGITFNTTGYDINLDVQQEYGHLVLSY